MTEEEFKKIKENLEKQMIIEQAVEFKNGYSNQLTEKINLYNEVIRLKSIIKQMKKYLSDDLLEKLEELEKSDSCE
jgi:hypothetical protein